MAIIKKLAFLMIIVVGREKYLPKAVYIRIPGTCSLTWQKGCDQGISDGKLILVYLCVPILITWVLKSRDCVQAVVRERCSDRRKGTEKWGVYGFEGWRTGPRGKGCRWHPEDSLTAWLEYSPANPLILAQGDSCLASKYRPVRWEICVVLSY